MPILQLNPNQALITFTVNTFVSIRQGKMMLTADPPKHVSSDLTANTNPSRLSRPNNDTFDFTVGNGPPVQLMFAVEPYAEYAAVDLFVQKVTSGNDGGAWDNLHVGTGQHDNVIYVRNKGKPADAGPFEYRVYMLIRRRDAGADYPLGDIGVIDPIWINR